uniref:CHAT domain-containing protein n=1 Tax=Intrasporangium sp. TaxID=1925024 RepID=UPI003221BFCC
MQYDELEVVLEPSGDGYTARVADSPTGKAPAMPFSPPADAADLLALRLAMRGPDRRAEPTPPASFTPKAFGTALFRALFNDKALNILRTSQFVAARHQRGLRLRIRFADVTELANLPWELLYDPDKHRYPCQYRSSPTIRVLDLPDPARPVKVAGPLRMLVVICGPDDLPDLDVEAEWRLLEHELEPLVRAGRIELVRLPVPTLEALHARVLAQEFHVFHFIGHGGIDANGEGFLAFAHRNGRARRVLGSHLGVMLSNSPIRLAVLNSCQGGTVATVDPYGCTAVALLEQGIPAVVAMQFPISDLAAQTFSRTLYDSVAAGRSVDLGVTIGRQAVLAASESEWATPVLYLRDGDGALFELEDGRAETILDEPPAPLPSLRTPAPHAGPQPATQSPSSPVPHPPALRIPEPTPGRIGPPPVVAPLAPTGLHGSTRGHTVRLGWDRNGPDGPVVREWEVYRNDEVVRHVAQPMVSDRPPGPGRYRYHVVALGEDGLRSPPSALWETVLPHRFRLGLVLFLLVTALG